MMVQLLINLRMSTILLFLLQLSLNTVKKGQAISPSCTCIRFTSSYGKERGIFSSPNYPRTYAADIDCLLYIFLAAPHEIVEIVFTDFDIYKGHLDCLRGDYLKVCSESGLQQGPGPPGGINEYSVWSRALCGGVSDAPPTLYSYGSELVLEFHTSMKKSNSTGFVGTFRFIDRRIFETDGTKVTDTWCDYVFSSHTNKPTSGRLYSPRYPSSYPSNIKCTYHFHARQHENIKIIFEESFLNKGDDSCFYKSDIVKVYDGRDTTAPVIAILCNEVIGYEVLSTGADLLIQFTANSIDPGQGFKARFEFQAEDNDTSTGSDKTKYNQITEIVPAVSATTSSCHKILNSHLKKNGKLLSPFYPNPYPPKTICHYDFMARGRERIKLLFEDFSLHKTNDEVIDCESMDSLDIFIYIDGRPEKMVAFCGRNIPNPVMSNGPKLSIEFRGIFSSKLSRGFKISYSFVEDFGILSGRQLLELPCAFVYNSTELSEGYFNSPNYPGYYPRDTECNYFFYALENEKVYLHFSKFDVEGVIPCEAISASDYVQFSSRKTSASTNRYCGQLTNFHMSSEDNFMRVTFKSNDRLDGTGFKASFRFIQDADMETLVLPNSSYRTSAILFKYFNRKYMLLIIILRMAKLQYI